MLQSSKILFIPIAFSELMIFIRIEFCLVMNGLDLGSDLIRLDVNLGRVQTIFLILVASNLANA